MKDFNVVALELDSDLDDMVAHHKGSKLSPRDFRRVRRRISGNIKRLNKLASENGPESEGAREILQWWKKLIQNIAIDFRRGAGEIEKLLV